MVTRVWLLAAAVAAVGCGASDDSVKSKTAAVTSGGQADPAHSTSLPKPPSSGPGQTAPGPSALERQQLIAKQQLYLDTVATKLQGDWKGLGPEELKRSKAALKQKILEGTP